MAESGVDRARRKREKAASASVKEKGTESRPDPVEPPHGTQIEAGAVVPAQPGEPVVPKRGRGRPTVCIPEVLHELLARIAQGRSLSRVCDDDDDMPDRNTLARFMMQETPQSDEFCSNLARARKVGARFKAASLEELADFRVDDYGMLANAEVQRRRIKAEARKWLLERENPDEYGNRTIVKNEGQPVERHEDRMRRLWQSVSVRVEVRDRQPGEVEVTAESRQIEAEFPKCTELGSPGEGDKAGEGGKG